MTTLRTGVFLAAAYVVLVPTAYSQSPYDGGILAPDAGGGYFLLPGGVIAHQSCIHAIPAGSIVDYQNNVYDGSHNLIASYGACSHPRRDLPRLSSPPVPGPSEWVEYVQDIVPATSNYDKVYAYWTVPPIPDSTHWQDGQTLYIFDGINSYNSDIIIQPVLQYFGGVSTAGVWRISNYIANSDTILYDDSAVTVSPGDLIYGQVFLSTVGEYISQYSDVTTSTTNSLQYEGCDSNTGCGGNAFGQFDGRGVEPAVLEVYGLQSCSDLPNTTSVAFSGIGTFEATDALWNAGGCNWAMPACYTQVTNYTAQTLAVPPINCGWSPTVNHTTAVANLSFVP